MPIRTFQAKLDERRGQSRAHPVIVLLTFVTAVYVVAALVHESLPPPNESAALAAPVQVPAAYSDDALEASSTIPRLSSTIESPDFQIEAPRECDLSQGISTACVFMD